MFRRNKKMRPLKRYEALAVALTRAGVPFFIFFGFLGFVDVIFGFIEGSDTWSLIRTSYQAGDDVLWLLVAFLTASWLQYRNLKEFLGWKDEGDILESGMTRKSCAAFTNYYILALASLVALVIFLYYAVIQTGGYFTDNRAYWIWIQNQVIWPMGFESNDRLQQVLTVIGNALFEGSRVLTYVALFTLFGLFSTLMVGGVALHNGFNGRGYDFTLFFEAILEMQIPEPVGVLSAVLLLAWSIYTS